LWGACSAEKKGPPLEELMADQMDYVMGNRKVGWLVMSMESHLGYRRVEKTVSTRENSWKG
jgi:hypothetical protein